MFDKYSNVEANPPISGDHVCPFCGIKNPIEALIRGEPTQKTKLMLDQIQETIVETKIENKLWGQIQGGEFDIYEALLELNRASKRYNNKLNMKTVGTSSYNGTINEAPCKSCGLAQTLNITLNGKIVREMPELIPIETWRKLKLPPHEILAKMTHELGGTIEELVASVNFKRYESARQFLVRMEELLGEFQLDEDFKLKLTDIMLEERRLLDTTEKQKWARFFDAVNKQAKDTVEHGPPQGGE